MIPKFTIEPDHVDMTTEKLTNSTFPMHFDGRPFPTLRTDMTELSIAERVKGPPIILLGLKCGSIALAQPLMPESARVLAAALERAADKIDLEGSTHG